MTKKSDYVQKVPDISTFGTMTTNGFESKLLRAIL